jgi:hypothetical protein
MDPRNKSEDDVFWVPLRLMGPLRVIAGLVPAIHGAAVSCQPRVPQTTQPFGAVCQNIASLGLVWGFEGANRRNAAQIV